MKDPIAIENVKPEIDCGRFKAKSIKNSEFNVEAKIFKAGHDVIRARLKYRKIKGKWNYINMENNNNDTFTASFIPSDTGVYEYTVDAWKDMYNTTLKNIESWLSAGEDVSEDINTALKIINNIYGKSNESEKRFISDFLEKINNLNVSSKIDLLRDNYIEKIIYKYQEKNEYTEYYKVLKVISDPDYAQFASWYELFPRSYGNFNNLVNHLDYIKSLNFDIVYLTPIHPIGTTNRRGKNGNKVSSKNDPGSPWAMGNSSGGHYSINPDLGNIDDFKNLIREIRNRNMDIAIDMAFQCSPDHPYVTEHPEWFYHRTDGSIRYAENPPKKYYDIYPLNFDIDDKNDLWNEMKNIIEYWINNGIKIFRIDNPHTKPFDFWEWLINSIKVKYPDVIFLAEAFTRENVMYELSKRGFSMSYTYFTWKNNYDDIINYFKELYSYPLLRFFRPMLFTNTPDILTRDLWNGRPAFIIKSILASTLSPLWGIYSGFELCENNSLNGTEEYSNSEKYEIKHRDFNAPGNIEGIIANLNRIRRDNESLQTLGNLCFCESNNKNIIAYVRYSNDKKNKLIIVINLDSLNVQVATIKVPLYILGMPSDSTYKVNDILNGNDYVWNGEYNYVRLIPDKRQAHIMVIE